MPIIAIVWRDVYDRENDHDRDVMGVLSSLTDFYDAIDSPDYAFGSPSQIRMEESLRKMLLHYRALHKEAIDADVKRWHEVPKHHYAHHIYLTGRYANPRSFWCYPDEDFMRVLKAPWLLVIHTC